MIYTNGTAHAKAHTTRVLRNEEAGGEEGAKEGGSLELRNFETKQPKNQETKQPTKGIPTTPEHEVFQVGIIYVSSVISRILIILKPK